MAAPVVTTFGDDDHAAGETGLTINGFQFGHFDGEAWMYANPNRTGLSDQLTVGTWGDMQLTGVEIPAVPNNTNGTVYLFVRTDGFEWSLPYAFTLSGAGAEIFTGGGGYVNWDALLPNSGRLVPLTDGAISGTGTIVLQGSHQPGGDIGAVLLTADGSNQATVVLRKNNATGDVLFDIGSVVSQYINPDIRVDDTAVLYYSVSGTGAGAMLYERVR